MATDLLNADVEHREDRPYDEADPSHLRHPNGSLVASGDRAFLAAACRQVLAAHLAANTNVPTMPVEGDDEAER